MKTEENNLSDLCGFVSSCEPILQYSAGRKWMKVSHEATKARKDKKETVGMIVDGAFLLRWNLAPQSFAASCLRVNQSSNSEGEK